MKYRFLVILFVVLPFFSFSQYSIHNLPHPKKYGQEFFVSNPDGILSQHTVKELDIQLQRLDSLTTVEFAIVIVDDYEGDDVFAFAHSLFERWGIGKQGLNNGLLLFVAKGRREYRFVTGYRMESVLPDAFLKRIGEEYLVPNFRTGDYDKGVIETAELIIKILESPSANNDLERFFSKKKSIWTYLNNKFFYIFLMFLFTFSMYLYIHKGSNSILLKCRKKSELFTPIYWGIGVATVLFLLFLLLFKSTGYRVSIMMTDVPYLICFYCFAILTSKLLVGVNRIRNSVMDEGDRQLCLQEYLNKFNIPMLLVPFMWGVRKRIIRELQENSKRLVPPDSSGEWERVVRNANGIELDYLNDGQEKEESIGSREYEIWVNKKTNSILPIPWDINHRFSKCPECNFFTMKIDDYVVLRKSTYDEFGIAEVFDKCYFCTYKLDKGREGLPKLQTSSSSSRGGGSSFGEGSGSGGSSSSSGSFGGGSSGGGGAGGRW